VSSTGTVDSNLHLAASSTLQQAMDAALSDATRERVLVGLCVEEQESYGIAGAIEEPGRAEAQRFYAGCIMKLFTAALVRQELGARAISLDVPATSLFPPSPGAATTLAGITVRHLLEHTHGLDGSAIRAPRWLPGEFLDPQSVLDAICPRPIAPPGKMYSYGHAGLSIAAVILEQITQTPYIGLLEQLGIAPRGEPGEICPATGDGFRVEIGSLMRFLRAEMRLDGSGLVDATTLADIELRVTARPGWSVAERGAFLGWNYQGLGWFGHNSILPFGPALVRVNPSRRIALVVATGGMNPLMVVARLFADSLPELLRMESPKLLPAGEAGTIMISRYEGHYENQRARLSITDGGNGQLKVEGYAHATPTEGASVLGSTSLRPAECNVFVARPAHPKLARIFQFLADDSGSFGYLWDGETLYPRSPPSPGV
jgi:CubicO group peptidase (beta-lactamase class C family)